MTDDDIYKERKRLASGCRIALQISNLTRAEAAARLGVSGQSVSNWCSAATKPSPDNLARLARLANMEIDDIREGRLPNGS